MSRLSHSQPRAALNLPTLILCLLLAVAGAYSAGIWQQAPLVPYLHGFTMMFVSILLEALPFVLLGCLISSAIHLYVSEELFIRVISKNRHLGLLVASLMGLVFPICECAIVPIVRGLTRKGVPIGMGVTLMLAVPIVNPVVLASTYYAFGGEWSVVLLRAFCGILVAIFVGDIMGILYARRSPLLPQKHTHSHSCQHDHHHDHTCSHGHHDHGSQRSGLFASVSQLLRATSSEVFDVGRFLIMGAGLSALLQTAVPRQYLLTIGRGNLSSILAMMLLAYLLSLCSEADAFIARTFMGQFTNGSILAFLVFGPMTDLKNTLLLLGAYEKRFAYRITLITGGAVLFVALLANSFGL